MVKKRHERHEEIVELAYKAPPGTPAGVEVMTLAELRRRAPEGLLVKPQRLDFHQIIAVRSGAAEHTVDFTGHWLEAGSVLWVRPGQVQQFGEGRPGSEPEGVVVLVQPGFLPSGTAVAAVADDPFRPVLWQPVGPDREAVFCAVGHLESDFRTGGGLPADVHTDVLRHLLSALVLRLAHLSAHAGSSVPAPGDTFVRFRAAVERDFATHHRVADYARALGYSTRTLARASLCAAGVGAKEFIDRRVMLEAKRLLAHSDLPAARIAGRVGFDDPANFSKFFHHREGCSPGAFRTALRRGGGPGEERPGEGRPGDAPRSK
ncbi:helix-turn-helix domain-containing protein [Streptomyces albireticuli]|uniref:AraC family transcriptional regulator n=1 Tax=Streptomyces albireticuli TaxID=1940 RepID=A0A2A2CYZ4_9ACTN|nr:AraC family transcriptional regulator [Streptomyces albireticuli]MCD9143935.1 helix-turn-helix domain-containing protein [Streptomyces albireticuli]MCD9161634.1 helix-turn-helix domain-containing protein [Streptomyces albireticuli]MCD9192052.1 helix-turn-helix domain-containing protein [Streptomyces albireticuli]PAU44464.1 AraC family transcriptional regulator [Streptomyces albireticuli]